jgi:hypothetical protein
MSTSLRKKRNGQIRHTNLILFFTYFFLVLIFVVTFCFLFCFIHINVQRKMCGIVAMKDVWYCGNDRCVVLWQRKMCGIVAMIDVWYCGNDFCLNNFQ